MLFAELACPKMGQVPSPGNHIISHVSDTCRATLSRHKWWLCEHTYPQIWFFPCVPHHDLAFIRWITVQLFPPDLGLSKHLQKSRHVKPQVTASKSTFAQLGNCSQPAKTVTGLFWLQIVNLQQVRLQAGQALGRQVHDFPQSRTTGDGPAVHQWHNEKNHRGSEMVPAQKAVSSTWSRVRLQRSRDPTLLELRISKSDKKCNGLTIFTFNCVRFWFTTMMMLKPCWLLWNCFLVDPSCLDLGHC